MDSPVADVISTCSPKPLRATIASSVPTWSGAGARGRLADARYYGIAQYAADMVTLIARLNVEKLDWFGTSMGGLIGMTIASLPDTPVHRLLLNDVGPHIEAGALERIGEYLGPPVRFDTQQQAIDYLWQISQSFGPHTPEQWRALSEPLLREQEGGWTLRYDPRIGEAFRSVTPEQVAAGEASALARTRGVRRAAACGARRTIRPAVARDGGAGGGAREARIDGRDPPASAMRRPSSTRRKSRLRARSFSAGR